MPAPNSFGQQELDTPNSVVIVGANGSGKTRLGTWFEFTGTQQNIIHRVAAQRSVEFPDTVSTMNIADAEFGFKYGLNLQGYSNQHLINHRSNMINAGVQNYKKSTKWQEHPETSQQNDYSSLLGLLFSEQNKINLAFTQQARAGIHITPPHTKLELIKNIWEYVLPHRRLIIDTNSINVEAVGPLLSTGAYKASEMSDGERVAFYLIGQCLTAPSNSIIVADEPEIHLHKIIQARLWDAIERARPDCLFVYLTHDLDFAASRTKAKKLWIKNYDGQNWDWQEVPPESEGLPEEVLLAVLGSRKPILFTEGDRGGSEQAVFSKLYPGWTIMPRGGCEEVIKSTQAFRALRHLHGIDCQGIVDLDYRTPREVTALLAQGIHVLSVQEIENLLLIESVLTIVATHAHESGLTASIPADIVQNVKKAAFDNLTRDKEALASQKTAWQLEQHLHKIDRQSIGVAALEKARDAAAQFDVAATYADFEREINNILASQDYAGLLRIYNNKGLAKQAGKFFGTLSYLDFVKRLLSTDKGEAIIQALQAAAPSLTTAAAQPTAVAPVIT